MKPRSPDRRERSATINALIAENIRTVRLEQQLTQKECSLMLAGSCESYWRSLETGSKHMSLLRMVEVSDVLGCPVARLLEGV